MVYTLLYKRPAQVPPSRDSTTEDEKEKSINESIRTGCSCTSNGIPDNLSFDKIVAGGTCPPLTLRDMMNYLVYVEHSAENLQFYLWYRDYCKRFEALPDAQKTLSPPWTKSDAEAAQTKARRNNAVDAMLKDTMFSELKTATERVDPFNTPPASPSLEDKHDHSDEDTLATITSHQAIADTTYDGAGMKWMPFTMQPYREEITRIITVYISDGAPRQLNLSDRERRGLLHALQTTTHPSAFKTIGVTVEYSLRKQSHPNFLRWTICNGNRPRVIFARGLGIFGILGGLLADLLITLSHAGRAWRVLPFVAWFIGIATLFAAWKGMCVVLHGMHHRHLRPWELFEEMDEKHASRDSLTSSSTNSFEDEPWVQKYERRNVIRQIFDREVWIEEPALRQIQDTVFVQALLTAFVLSGVAVGIFCAVPAGNFF